MPDAPCAGSYANQGTSPGQRSGSTSTGKSTHASGVHCPRCGRRFNSCKIIYTQQGIDLGGPMAVVPRHKEAEEQS